MITIQSRPPEVFFAGNPVLYDVHTNNFLSYIGRKCSFTLMVFAADTDDGHTLSFEFPDKTIIFTTSGFPDDSGAQIQTAPNSSVFSSWAQTLFDCFQSNFDISSRCSMTLGAATSGSRAIHFLATKEGMMNSAVVISNLVTVTKTLYISGLDSIPRNNFSIVGGIWDKNMTQLVHDVKPVNEMGNARFNFSEYLSALLDSNTLPRFTYPLDAGENLKSFSNFVLPYYAGFAERFDGKIQKLHFDTLRNAFPGGLNRETLVWYNAKNTDFFSATENLLSFMTWAPTEKATGKTVPEKLFFKVDHNTGSDTITLNIIVCFTDNTTATIESDAFAIVSDLVIECSVGFGQLRLETLFPGKVVSSWKVWLSNPGGTAISEFRTFILDPMVYENERIFIFQNSFGRAYDVVRFTGKGVVNINIESTTGNSQNSEVCSPFNPPSRKFEASETQKMKTNSGWVPGEMKDYFREILLSREVFEYKDDLLYPVVITNDSLKEFFKDGEYLYSLDLEYDRAWRDIFFSKLSAVLSVPVPAPQSYYSDDYSTDYS